MSRLRTTAVAPVGLWVALLAGAGAGALAQSTPPPRVTDPAEFTASEPLLGDAYPLEIVNSFSTGLMHWVDSLAGLQGVGFTAGKTIEAHRSEYRQRFGEMHPESTRHLLAYRKARMGFAARNPDDPYGMTRAFFTEEPLFVARARAASLIPLEDRMPFIRAVDHFAVPYRVLWSRGERGRRFLQHSPARTRGELALFLQQVAAFLEVDPAVGESARLFVVPVPSGHGTHAQAIGTSLLFEVRPAEGLTDQVEPIVHENVHFLVGKMPVEKLRQLELTARRHGARGRRFYANLREALPTAIGQGVAGQRFRKGDWSRADLWYHRRDVDLQAKQIFPVVIEAFDTGATFDSDLLRRLLGSAPTDAP